MKKIYLSLFTIGLASASFAQLQTIYWTGVHSNELWSANADGTGTPTVLVSNICSGSEGPVGVDYVEDNDSLYVTGGNNSEVVGVPASGGTPTIIANSTDGSEHHDVDVDYANGRYFFSGADGGIYVADLAGALPAVNIHSPMSGNGPSTVVYDATNDRVFFNEVGNAYIFGMDPDGSNLDTLFQGVDGVDGPRHMVLDEASQTLYWTNRGSGSIMKGSADGSGTLAEQYTGHPGIYGIYYDNNADQLYFSTFDGNGSTLDTIFKAEADGSLESVLFAGNFAGARGISGKSDAGASINEASIDELTVYPNPAKDEVSIKIDEAMINKEVVIVDINGAIVKTKTLNTTTISVDISNFEAGIYFIQIDGLKVEKFVKQ